MDKISTNVPIMNSIKNNPPKTAVILVNYKKFQHTLECLESLIRSEYTNFQIIIVENGSENETIDELVKWADGITEWDGGETEQMRSYSHPPVKKPVPYVIYSQQEAKKGGDPKRETEALQKTGVYPLTYPLVFIKSDKNMGFAGGNNLGICYAKTAGLNNYFWLLNTDTVIKKNTLTELIEYMELPKNGNIGMAGAKLLYYHFPETIQCVSGLLNPKFATTKNYGAYEKDKGQFDTEDIPIDYIQGACMFIRITCLNDIGPMEEGYFLYFEEADWAIYAKKAGWKLGFCPKAVVYHKEGASTGYSPIKKIKTEMMDYYSFRSRILFTKKHYPQYLSLVKFSFIGVIITRIFRLQFDRIKLVIDTVFLNKQVYVKDKKVIFGKNLKQ